jgi:hypothetical protein
MDLAARTRLCAACNTTGTHTACWHCQGPTQPVPRPVSHDEYSWRPTDEETAA